MQEVASRPQVAVAACSATEAVVHRTSPNQQKIPKPKGEFFKQILSALSQCKEIFQPSERALEEQNRKKHKRNAQLMLIFTLEKYTKFTTKTLNMMEEQEEEIFGGVSSSLITSLL